MGTADARVWRTNPPSLVFSAWQLFACSERVENNDIGAKKVQIYHIGAWTNQSTFTTSE
jgi:hypothetical protein